MAADRSILLGRCVAIIPLLITVLVLAWSTSFLNSLVGPETFLGDLLSRLGLKFVEDSTAAYIIGWGFVLGAIFALGIFVEAGMKRFYGRLTQALFNRLPLIGKLYDTSKQLVDMLDKHGDDQLKGMSAVFCSFGEKGGAGLLALLPTPEAVCINGREHHVVLVPQSPVPIGGGLLFVPVESVEHVGMSIDTFMSIYVSMGVTVPAMMRD